ncbi:MAG TPA: cupredoxin domain-containing protein [Sphingomonas sp.]|nr:cupredoxin domain-containing protein [Sphingomonas sp.]
MHIAAIAAIGLAAAVQTPDWGHAQTVTVQLSNFKFAPATLELERGTPYRLHLVNRASGGHDFVARQFFANSTIAPEDRGEVVDGQVDLRGGDTADIRIVPTTPGTYEVHCSHFMHTTFGMKGTITVR